MTNEMKWMEEKEKARNRDSPVSKEARCCVDGAPPVTRGFATGSSATTKFAISPRVGRHDPSIRRLSLGCLFSTIIARDVWLVVELKRTSYDRKTGTLRVNFRSRRIRKAGAAFRRLLTAGYRKCLS